jgi:hypothetical protein
MHTIVRTCVAIRLGLDWPGQDDSGASNESLVGDSMGRSNVWGGPDSGGREGGGLDSGGSDWSPEWIPNNPFGSISPAFALGGAAMTAVAAATTQMIIRTPGAIP